MKNRYSEKYLFLTYTTKKGENNPMDDMEKIEEILKKSERPINKYYVSGGDNPGWCLRLESDDAQRELVLTFDEYGRIDKIL